MVSKDLTLALIKRSVLVGTLLMQTFLVHSQIPIATFTAYSQNFSSLPQTGSTTWTNNSTLNGWYASSNLTFSSIAASNGSDNTVGLKSYGSVSSVPTDRALGCVTSGAASGTGDVRYGVRFVNNIGKTIKSFTVSFAMEVWLDAKKQDPTLYFDYSKGANLTSLTSGTWTSVSDLTTTVIVQGNRGTVDGNLSNTRLVRTTSVHNVNLEIGEEIIFRWTDPHDSQNNYVGIDDVVITPAEANGFYNKDKSAVTSLASWGTNSNGTGTQPTSFASNNQSFNFINTNSYTLPANWNISGSNSRLVIGDNATNITFTIPANNAFTGEIDVKDNSKLVINNAALPTLGTLGTQSTIEYNNAANQVLDEADYGILSIGTGTKRLGANIRIKGGLSFNNSKLELNAYDILLDETVTVTGANASAYIVTNGAGSLKRTVKNNGTAVDFPVGTTTYLPVKISQPAGSVADVFSVKAIDGIYETYTNNVPSGLQFGSRAVGKTWVIDEAVKGGSNITLTVNWAATNSLPNFDPSLARIVHFTNGSWDDSAPLVASLASGRYSVSRSGITSFSPFAVFSGDPNPLPVELVRFEASHTENGIVCEWETATERNSQYFGIERSQDGRTFQEIGRVEAQKTNSQFTSYHFKDFSAPAGITYYRLRQADVDGAITYSGIISVRERGKTENAFILSPNPANEICYLKTSEQVSGLVTVAISNAQGKRVGTYQVDGEMLQRGVPLDLIHVPKGVYLVEILTKEKAKTLRIIRQ
jgi:hypothetical protein